MKGPAENNPNYIMRRLLIMYKEERDGDTEWTARIYIRNSRVGWPQSVVEILKTIKYLKTVFWSKYTVWIKFNAAIM